MEADVTVTTPVRSKIKKGTVIINRTKSLGSPPVAAINNSKPYRNIIGGSMNLLKIDTVKKANRNTTDKSASLTAGETKDGKKSPLSKRQQ